MFRRYPFIVVGLASLLLASTAWSETFQVSVSGLGSASGPIPQSLLNGVFTGSLGTTGLASAAATRGVLKAKSFCQNPISCRCTPQTDRFEGGTATLQAPDVLISGPTGVTEVATTLHLILDGTLAVGGDFPWGANVEVGVNCGSGGGGGFINLSGPNDGGLRSGGILSGQLSPAVSRAIDIPTVVPVNTPFTLVMSMNAVVGGTSFGVSVNTGSSNFFDAGGLHFPTAGPFKVKQDRFSSTAAAGPVFTLPDGYTANIPSLNVVNNTWINGEVTPAARTSWGHLKVLYH